MLSLTGSHCCSCQTSRGTIRPILALTNQLVSHQVIGPEIHASNWNDEQNRQKYRTHAMEYTVIFGTGFTTLEIIMGEQNCCALWLHCKSIYKLITPLHLCTSVTVQSYRWRHPELPDGCGNQIVPLCSKCVLWGTRWYSWTGIIAHVGECLG